MNSVIIDSNIFTLFIVGMINPKQISNHKRTSIYNENHYNKLVEIIGVYDQIYTCPNIITEVDNLLNNTSGDDRNRYLCIIKKIINDSNEKYIESKDVIKNWHFENVGLTDSVVLIMAQHADLLVSGDSELCDYARSMKIKLFDFKAFVNQELIKNV